MRFIENFCVYLRAILEVGTICRGAEQGCRVLEQGLWSIEAGLRSIEAGLQSIEARL